ncbi:MAG: PAQR family membrane homeostasis protein TrhA [Hyphomonadaceae bacterium]|jgi:hemolysin III|uniref:PAQR family membrane homeostasis protein TrhA n=1 Tax=Aquidulcibacter sp. TaxID=2052990 RepID=UPI0022C4C820|nr:hemolysin III family protein [Aquidulcibacter sp.]MCE2892563.1 hemolysin III family protein [Hyphomonadaceae bacterium]MCZ8208065.1 hemolysin III family protein [Aquidulcibacter sp.]
MTTDLDHYPSAWARRADLIVHIAGLTLALFGGGLALGLAVSNGMLGKVAAVSIYALGLIAMLAFSLAYNFAKPNWQPFLRRLDHAGIFLMIAASYTPFTTQALTGAWSIGMTTAVWALAALGMAGKMFLPGLGKAIWVVLYLALGWMVVIAIKPMIEEVPAVAMWLLAAGGVVYSVGTIFYAAKGLKFRRAIWHGHVVAAAGLHYAAILVGVVLVGAN